MSFDEIFKKRKTHDLLICQISICHNLNLYIKAANQLIRQYSDQSSICFLYMPPPPPNRAAKSSANTSANESSSMANGSIIDTTPTTMLATGAVSATTAFISTLSQESANEDNKRYMRILETLSDSLNSCAFVNGVSCVTSTHL